MPFKHIVDDKRKIVALKVRGHVTIVDIISEIQKAMNTKRGEGIARRLIDMTDAQCLFELESVQKILKVVNISASVLGAKRMAILFKEMPANIDIEALRPQLGASGFEIGLFTEKVKAAEFLNTSPAHKG